MTQSGTMLKKSLLVNALNWFRPQFRQKLVSPIESQFPNYPLPGEIQAILRRTDYIWQRIQGWGEGPIPVAVIADELSKAEPERLLLFKQIILLYRRDRAAYTERLTEKTFHLELATTLEEEVKALDAVTNEEWFQKIDSLRLPRLNDFLPVQYIEAATVNEVPFSPRRYDEKFHILQAPHLFLPDLAYFRAKYEDRDTPLAVAFLDIDNFKEFNTKHHETKVDRNLLPRFMQSVEAHVFHHGFAYRQGGDEYLILIPSMSKQLCIAFLDELRRKLADLPYPEIAEKTTVSIGLCIVESDCPLTDRELRDRAGHAKNFAKGNGKNCLATYDGPRLTERELQVVKSSAS